MIPVAWLAAAGVIALGLGVYAAVRAAERKRREAYEEFSLVRGFRFEAERLAGERQFEDALEVFAQGRRRRWGYTISGTRNRAPFTAFEYRWVTGGGKQSSTHQIGGVVWERDGAALPAFALAPENWFLRLGELFGQQDVDFAESAEFSRAYRLKGPDEAAIRSLFTREIRQFFAATTAQQVAGGGRFLVWWRRGRLPAADRLDEWLEQADQVRRRFFKE